MSPSQAPADTNVTLVDGAPGAGKTYKLRKSLEDEVSHGLGLGDFYWLNFSNAGRKDVEPEIADAFAGEEYPDHMEPADRAKTFHGLALSLAIKRNMIAGGNTGKDQIIDQGQYVGKDDVDPYIDFCERHAVSYDPHAADPQKLLSGETTGRSTGNKIFAINDWLTQTCKPVSKWKQAGITVEGCGNVEGLLEAWDDYKKSPPHADYRLFEHGDYIALAADASLVPDVDVLFIDEFQDLAPVEYRLYKLWRDHANIKQLYIAGDANQAIYPFRGGTSYYFENTDHDDRVELKESRRCPENIANFAAAVIDAHAETDARNFRGYTDGGRVSWREFSSGKQGLRDSVIEATDQYDGDPSVMLLTRTNNQLGKLTRDLRKVGIPFEMLGSRQGVWKDDLGLMLDILGNYASGGQNFNTEALRAIVTELPDTTDLRTRMSDAAFGGAIGRDGIDHVFAEYDGVNDIIGNLGVRKWKRDVLRNAVEAPAAMSVGEVKVGTIHAAKGLEAPAVYLFADTSKGMKKRYTRKTDAAVEEHRVYYVGASRASEELTIVNNYFNGPTSPPLRKARIHVGGLQ